MNTEPRWQRDALWLGLAIGLFFLIGLGARPYLVPSEARYIEIPRQILTLHDWLTPRINGVPYFEKPPLFYWLQAGVMSVLGSGEFAGRLMTALLATLNCLIVYAIGRMLYGRDCGWVAALMLATCVLGYGMSRIAMLDLPVTVFLTLCLGSFLAAHHTGKARWYYAMYASAALAVMTKGLIGILIPGMVIGAWIALTHQWALLLRVRLFSGLLLFLAIALPWHVQMMQTHPEFFNFYIIHEHFTRFLTEEHKRDAPWWFFILVTLVGMTPWIGLLPQAVKTGWRDRYGRFLLLWALLPLLFFSASHSKLVPYIFPIFPALAIVIARYTVSVLPTRPRLRKAIRAALLFMAMAGISANFAVPLFDTSSAKPLVETLQARLKPEDSVVAYQSYWQDIPVYLGRNVIVADYQGELRFGAEHYPETASWMISKAEFLSRCRQRTHPIYVFMRPANLAEYDAQAICPLHEIARYGKTVLLETPQ